MCIAVSVQMVPDIGIEIERLQSRECFDGAPEVFLLSMLLLIVADVFVDAVVALWTVAFAEVKQTTRNIT